MRFRLGVKFEVGKLDIYPFADDKQLATDAESYLNQLNKQMEQNKSYITHIITFIWSTNYKVRTKSHINTLIDEQYED